MIKKLNFDYDRENDNLFLYDLTSKSNSSVEISDLVIDFNKKKEITAIEIFNASIFFSEVCLKKDLCKLTKIKNCMLEIIPKGGFNMIKLQISFDDRNNLIAPIYIPSLNSQCVV